MFDMRNFDVQELSKLGSRGAFGKALIDIGEKCPDVVVVTADLADATRATWFKDRFPDRFFNVGVAEQNLMGVASGLALAGKTVFATSFATFASLRCCEQVRTDVGYQNVNVKILGADGGVVAGTLGNTHYAVEDISIIRALPNLTVLSPADGLEIVKATWAAALYKGPVYIRLTGYYNNPTVYEKDYDFKIGKAITLKDGNDAAIIATGAMVHQAFEAGKILTQKKINARVIDMHTIKPLDENIIKKAVKETKLIVTVEEHTILGGLGGAVAEVMSEQGGAPRLIRIGLPDKFGPIGTYDEQLERYNLTAKYITDKVKVNFPMV